METEEIIICKACNEAKPLSDFQISKHFKSGHATICKACHGKRIAAAHLGRKTQCTPPSMKYVVTRSSRTNPRDNLSLRSGSLLRN